MGRVLFLFRQVTTLQPRAILFWDMGRVAHGLERKHGGDERSSSAATGAPDESGARIFCARKRFPRARDQE